MSAIYHQGMTENEFAYHRAHAKSIVPLGECSRMENGLIKVEGYEPFARESVYLFLERNLKRPYSRTEYADKLLALY